MSDEKVEVKSLVIRIGGEERKVSIEDARGLWLVLDGFFGPKTPLYGPTLPVVVERERWPEYPKPAPVWCGGGGTDRPLPDLIVGRAKSLRSEGASLRAISRELKVSPRIVARVLREKG